MTPKKTSRSAPSVQSGAAKLGKKPTASGKDQKPNKPLHERMPIPAAKPVPLAEILKRKKTDND